MPVQSRSVRLCLLKTTTTSNSSLQQMQSAGSFNLQHTQVSSSGSLGLHCPQAVGSSVLQPSLEVADSSDWQLSTSSSGFQHTPVTNIPATQNTSTIGAMESSFHTPQIAVSSGTNIPMCSYGMCQSIPTSSIGIEIPKFVSTPSDTLHNVKLYIPVATTSYSPSVCFKCVLGHISWTSRWNWC